MWKMSSKRGKESGKIPQPRKAEGTKPPNTRRERGGKRSPAEGSARDLGKTVQFSSAMLGETEMLPPWRETSLKKVSKKVRGT